MPRDTAAYTIDGERWPSVTEVLDAVSLCDYSAVPIENMLNAGRRGEAIHCWIDLYETGHLSPGAFPDEEIEPYIDAYHRFVDETGFEIEETEKVVVCRTHRYVGTLDLLGRYTKGRYKGWRGLVDLKAAASIFPWVRLQIMGYTMALQEMEGSATSGIIRASVQLRADRTYRLAPYVEDAMDVHDWAAAVRLTHWKIRHRQLTITP